MNNPILIVSTIIVFAGIIGGLAAYLVETVQSDGAVLLQPTGEAGDEPKLVNETAVEPAQRWFRRSLLRRKLARFVLLGIIASACVPLFLSLLKSLLIQSIFTVVAPDGRSPLPPAYESYLTFVGLCLIASVSARKFIDSISKQVFDRLNEVDAKADKAEAKADKATATSKDARDIARFAADEVEGADNVPGVKPPADLEEAGNADLVESKEPIPVSDDERKILKALQKKTYRTRTGVSEDSGISRNRISEMLEQLADRKLALPTTSPKTGGKRWIITNRGTAALRRKG